MRRARLVLGIVALARLAAAQPQPNQAQQPATGTAVIRGRVYDGDGGRPLRRAQVRAVSAGTRINTPATTDEQGLYEIRDLPAGTYTVTAFKTNYISLQYGQRTSSEMGRPVVLLDSQTIEKIDITLPRGGVITGHVVDEFGDAVPNAQVTLVRARTLRGRRRLEQGGRTTTTDDLGEYRLFGLNPGDYYVSVNVRVPPGPPTDPDVPGYAMTLAPGTTSAAEAQKVAVGASQTVEEINVALVPAKLARISGSAFNSNGEPMAGGNVSAAPRDQTSINMYGAQLRPDGTFLIQNVPPGDYNLTAQAAGAPGATRPDIASASVSVAGSDLNGVQLVVVPPATVTGTFIVDPAAVSTLNPASLRLMILPLDLSLQRFGPSGSPNDIGLHADLTFEAHFQPGPSYVSVMAPNGFALQAVRLNGADITDTGFDAKPNETIRGMEIEFTSHPTSVSGTVNDARGSPTPATQVLIFSSDERKWDGLSRYTRITVTDQDAKFKATGLPPGDYYAVAGSDLQPDSVGDPDTFNRLRSRAQSFSLNDGETKVFDLKVTTGS